MDRLLAFIERLILMRPFRFLHTSDWQLGMKRWFLHGEAASRYAQARLDVIDTLFNLAKTKNCEAIVVAGDVFDDNLIDATTWQRSLEILRHTPLPLYLLPGNHDPFDAASIYRHPVWQNLSPKVTVLIDSQPHCVPDNGAIVIGAPYLAKTLDYDPVAAAIHTIEHHKVRDTAQILVGHGATLNWGNSQKSGWINLSAAAESCQQGIIDFIALGDTHSTQSLHENGRIWYSGSPEPTDFRTENGGGESDSGNALIIDIKNDGSVQVDRIPVGKWHFLHLQAELNSQETVYDWIEHLSNLPHKTTTAVRCTLQGTLDLASDALLHQQMAVLQNLFAALYRHERTSTLRIIPSKAELQGNHFPGVVGIAALELIEQANKGEEIAQEALRLLYRLSHAIEVST